MTNFIRLNPTRWPYSLRQLREDEPSRSFSNSPKDLELAIYDVYRIVPQDQPPFDPATHRMQEVEPVLSGGQWLQQWQEIELTPAEAEAYYRSTHPPRWLEFSDALPPEVDELLNAARAASPRLELGLGVGLGRAADGDSRAFLSAWQTARTAGLVSNELAQGLRALAVTYDLPADFVEGLV